MERERRVKKGLGYDRWENVNEKERKRRADGDERSSAPSAHIGSTQSGTAGKERKEEGEKGESRRAVCEGVAKIPDGG